MLLRQTMKPAKKEEDNEITLLNYWIGILTDEHEFYKRLTITACD